jgi:hypothetical protein
LEIIIAAHRPLKLSEIDVALEVLPSSRSFDELDLEGFVKRKKWIRDVCGLFVSVVNSRVFLIHQTAREFLLQQGSGTAVAGTRRHSIDLQNARLSLTKLCLTYLCFEDFRMKGQQYRLQYIPQEGFLRYSGAYWMSHVKRSHNLGGEWIRKVVTLCEAGSESAYWISYHEGYSFWELCRNHNTARRQSLFWVAHWALTEAVIFLVDEQGMKITEDMIWATAISQEGVVPVRKFLLDRTNIRSPSQLWRLFHGMRRMARR